MARTPDVVGDLVVGLAPRDEPVVADGVDRADLQLDEERRRANLGQFLTPNPVADLMASFFVARPQDVKLLDAGAASRYTYIY